MREVRPSVQRFLINIRSCSSFETYLLYDLSVLRILRSFLREAEDIAMILLLRVVLGCAWGLECGSKRLDIWRSKFHWGVGQ
jgi:hypothetical protein